MHLKSHHKVAILLHEGLSSSGGKTGISLLRYSELPIVAVIDHESVGKSVVEVTGIHRDVPIVGSVNEALDYGAEVLAIGIAPSGGALPDAWFQELKQGVAAGLSVVNGLHTSMADDAELIALLTGDQWIWDVRKEPPGLNVGSGKARSLSCKRVLTVATDMSVGKMSTSLELHRVSKERGLRSSFIATGQTGLMLGHDGVPLDAVRIDFAAGAVEQAVMRQGATSDIVHVEGQGSLMNPASTATLPLMRGSQPTHLIMVHRVGQTHILNFEDFQIPPLPDAIQLCEMVASGGGTFTKAKVSGVALNTFGLSDEEATRAIAHIQDETGLPCTDAIRYGVAPLMDAIMAS
ncbi:MAG: DUF1611 domain-containing protein [Cyanobacteria bacterium P01_E01_bin.6]